MSESKLEALDEVIQQLKAGVPLSKSWANRPSELKESGQLEVKAHSLVKLCRSLGSSPVTALERLVEVERRRLDDSAELEGEWATPRATTRLVGWLPVGFISLAQLLGLPIFQAVATNVLAKFAVGAGVLLLVFARFWSRRILNRARPLLSDLADELDLLSVALTAGLSFEKSLDKIRASPELAQILVQERILARTTGAPIARLVLLRADRLRSKAKRQNQQRIREAAVGLMLPLGAAVLPALILLLVIPLAVGFAGQADQ